MAKQDKQDQHGRKRTQRPETRRGQTRQHSDARQALRKSTTLALRLGLALDEYERDLRRREIAAHTIRNYRKVLDLALRFWREQLAREPTLDDVTLRSGEAFIDHLFDRGKLNAWAHGGEAIRVATRETAIPYVTTTGVGPVGAGQADIGGAPAEKELWERPEKGALSVESVRCYVRTLKAFSAWLVAPKQRYTPENRLALLPMPRKSQTYKLPLDTREMQALIDACDVTSALGSRDLALLLLFLDGGLRAGEICGLRVGEVNLEDGQVFVACGKGRKSRLVTLGADTTHLLARYAFFAFFRDALAEERARPEDPFFQTAYGRPFTYEALRKWLIRLKDRAGVPRAFPHLLRHTSAVRTLEVPGADLIDHLGLDGLMRLVPPEKTDGRFFHRPRHPSQHGASARVVDGGGGGADHTRSGKRGPARDAAARRRREKASAHEQENSYENPTRTLASAWAASPPTLARTRPSSGVALRLLIRRTPLGGIVANARLGSECLWRRTPRAALDELHALIRRLWGKDHGRWQVSYAHLAHDVANAPLEREQLDRYVSRSRRQAVYDAAKAEMQRLLREACPRDAAGADLNWDELPMYDWEAEYGEDEEVLLADAFAEEGYEWDRTPKAVKRAKEALEGVIDKRSITSYIWGKRLSGVAFSPGGAVSFVMYRKDWEGRLKQKRHMEPLWKVAGWDGKEPVTRHEARLVREPLRELRGASDSDRALLDDPWQFLARAWHTGACQA